MGDDDGLAVCASCCEEPSEGDDRGVSATGFVGGDHAVPDTRCHSELALRESGDAPRFDEDLCDAGDEVGVVVEREHDGGHVRFHPLSSSRSTSLGWCRRWSSISSGVPSLSACQSMTGSTSTSGERVISRTSMSGSGRLSSSTTMTGLQIGQPAPYSWEPTGLTGKKL